MRRIIASLFLSAGLPILVFAQHAGVSTGAAHAAAPPVAMHALAAVHAVPASAHPVNVSAHGTVRTPATHSRPGGSVHSTVHSNIAVNTAHRVPSPANPVVISGARANDTFPVPGLGFDYPHFFATHPNFGRDHRTTGFILPFFGGGGFYVPYPYYVEPPTPEEEAEGYDPDAGQRAAEAAPATGANDAVSAARTYTPVQPQSEYVFVRRDGTVFFAIAYSWGSDKLQYVTKEGAHRTVAADTIDLDATQQFNEQRGISIRLPA